MPSQVTRVGPARRRRGLVAVAALLLAGLTAGAGGADRGAARVASTPIKLRVLVYNIEYGGSPETDAVIRQLHPDVVGVLESYRRLPEIARKTGYPYYNSSLQLLSKYPILEASGARGLYALIEVRPGYVVPFFNDHLDYVKWGPGRLRRGHSVRSVIATENRVRTSAMKQPFAAMRRLRAAGYPVFLTGDFNQPSSLDWTRATARHRPRITGPVPWPLSRRLHRLRFRDSYRETHPDPVRDPGITFPGTGDRIDYVYAAGPSTTLSSKLVGERGGKGVDIAGVGKWTSDHRAVLSTFRVKPAKMPPLVAVNKRLGVVGDRITISYNGSTTGGHVTIGPTTRPTSRSRGTVVVRTAGWEPGGYHVVLSDAAGQEIAQVPLFLRDPRARLRLSTDRVVYARGQPITVRWRQANVNRWDWLGVYKASASNPRKDSYLIWRYTAGHAAGTLPPSTNGTASLGGRSQGKPWPLPPGRYVVHYLLHDQYRSAGSATFRVRGHSR